jgi:Ca2+-binding EF-hand superfamily protein
MMRALPSLFFVSALVIGGSVALAADAKVSFWPEEADSNSDDMISKDEAMVLSQKMFDRYDYDGSGDISLQEWRMIIDDRMANAKKENPNTMGPSDMDNFTAQTFHTHDTDGDGKISKGEWEARVDARFAELDSNGDGMIERDEAANVEQAQKKGE